jgi:antitoxin ParD1/3/4
MAEGINVRFAGELQRFVQSKTEGDGLYTSASEYIRDLVRRDYERSEESNWRWLREELKRGATADESEFVPLDASEILKEAKAQHKARGR